jgi:4-amino-4-deoxy-L-arabinose transferase-like glycosyltransferase
MGDLEKSEISARTGQEGEAFAGAAQVAVFDGEEALPDQERRWETSSPARRSVRLVLVVVTLAGAVAMQVYLGTYAASGGGAAQVSVPPGPVALSVALCAYLALLLSWRGLRARARAWYRALTEIEPARPRTPRPARLQAISQLPRRARAALPTYRWPGVRRAWRWLLCAFLLLLALIASLIADLGARTFAGRPAAQWWWVGSAAPLIAAAAAYTLLKRQKPEASAPGTARTQRGAIPQERVAQESASPSRAARLGRLWEAIGDPVLLVVLLEGALLLRLPNLTNQPYVLHGDEAACGLEALRWLHGGVPSLISVGWYGLPVLGYGYPALVMRVAGENLFGLRLSSVIIGVLSIALLYALAREFAGRRVAFVAAALMTVSHLAIQFSRMGIHYIHAPFVVLLTLWMLVRALRRNSALAAAIAGVGLSLAVQVYFSARIIFVIVPLFLVGLLLLYRQWLKGRLLMLGWLALSFVVSFGPMGVYFLSDTGALKSRPAEVLILNLTDEMRNHLLSQFGTVNLSTILTRQLAAIPLLVGGLPDQSLQYGPLYPMFDALVAALVTTGFFYALLHLKRPLCLLLVIWVVSTVALGGVLTMDMPWWPRLLVMVPALCLLAALALEEMLRAAERAWQSLEWSIAPGDPGRRWRAAVLGGLLALAVIGYSGGQSIRHYFIDYPREVNGVVWRALYTDIARYAAQLPAGTQVVLFSDDSVIWDYEPIRFLDSQVNGQRTGDPAMLQTILAHRSGPTIIIITLTRVDTFHTLLATPGALPPGSYHAQRGALGQVSFYTYTISGG